MTDTTELDADLRKRLWLSETGRNPPPHLHTDFMAQKHGFTEEFVTQRLRELNPSKRRR